MVGWWRRGAGEGERVGWWWWWWWWMVEEAFEEWWHCRESIDYRRLCWKPEFVFVFFLYKKTNYSVKQGC